MISALMRPACAAMALFMASIGVLFGRQFGADWKQYLGGPASSHYSPLKQINIHNVEKLKIAWSYPTRDDLSYRGHTAPVAL